MVVQWYDQRLNSLATRSTTELPGDINFDSRMGHMKTSFVWQESLLNKNFNPKCVVPVSLFQQLGQNRCSELVSVMGKAVR
jgi:hypothetical protein